MGGKKINGRKRQILVDTNGFLLCVLVHTADITDSEGAEWVLSHYRSHFPRLQVIRVDQGYKDWLVTRACETYRITIDIVVKPADQVGFAVIPKRWVVERSIAWLCRNRRLSKDYEREAEYSESWLYLASIRLLLKRRMQG